MKGLTKNSDHLVFTPEDKGRAVLVMGKVDYQQNVLTLLNDETTYQKLEYDPTVKQ